jgi:23S rRNA (uracil1939-C5)-methyltransferase
MELIVDIERILPGGVGFAHADGKTVFVSLAAPGDRVRVSVDREQGKVLFASIKEIITGSPYRVEPPCPYFGRCGGCDFQQLSYDAQLAAKASIIRDSMHRIAKIEEAPEFVVEPSPEMWRYRARATWQIDQDKHQYGYYERNSRRVCDVAECAVLVPSLQTTLEQLRNTEEHEFPPLLQHLDVVSGDNGVSLAPEFAEFQTKELSLKVDGEAYCYNAEAFFQVNQQLLPSLVEFSIGDARGDTAVDLYCGVGLFTLPLARRFARVVGVESNPAATRFARRNLQAAGLTNASVQTASLSDWMLQADGRDKNVDFVLLDPPRAGVESVVIRGILDLEPKRITYVSCDPATLARDLKKLMANGYAIESLKAFDMFPQTHHVETVVHLGALRSRSDSVSV